MLVSLILIKPDGSQKQFPVTKPKLVIGRKNSCDLRIPLPSISRQHCQLALEDDGVWLKDLDSSNGTFCNHERIERTKLEAGDEISLGPVSFTVVIDGEPAGAMPADPVQARSAGDGVADDPLASLDRLAEDLD